MVRDLLIRGMLVGLVAGLLVFAFGWLIGEPRIDQAIAFEAAMHEAHGKADIASDMGHAMPAMDEGPEIVSRETQASFGLLTAVVVYSVASGGLFALVFACAHGRIGNLRPRAVSALLALGAFIAVYLAPNLKYPANPPAVGEPDTIGLRTGLYFLTMLISITAAVLAIMAQRRLARRNDAWTATLLAAAGYLVIVATAGVLLPSVSEVPEGFPAALLWQFRMASFGMQAVMWTTIGLLFGALTDKAMAGRLRIPARGLV